MNYVTDHKFLTSCEVNNLWSVKRVVLYLDIGSGGVVEMDIVELNCTLHFLRNKSLV